MSGSSCHPGQRVDDREMGMALRKGLVEPVYGPVLRQSVVGRDGAVIVQRPGGIGILDVSLGHDGLCFDDAEIVFSWSKAYVARYAFIRAGKLAGMRYPGLRQCAFAGAGRTGGVGMSSTRTSSRVNGLAELGFGGCKKTVHERSTKRISWSCSSLLRRCGPLKERRRVFLVSVEHRLS